MSEPDDRPIIPPPLGPTPPPHQPSGCVTALIGLVGVILLLPGLCVWFFMSGARLDSGVMPFVLACVIVAVFGILLIGVAIARASR